MLIVGSSQQFLFNMIIVSDFPPTAQKRPRVTRFVTYDPSKKDKVAFLKTIFNQLPPIPSIKPLNLQITFNFEHPKTHLKKNGELRSFAPIHHTSKPDIDNLVKFVLDALNGHLYVDDSQIIGLTALKKYAPESCIEIKVVEITE